MKIKMNLYITNAEIFSRDPSSSDAYALQSGRHMDATWTFAGEVEFDIDVDTASVIETARADLNEEIGKHTAAINILENRKNELLAITHDRS